MDRNTIMYAIIIAMIMGIAVVLLKILVAIEGRGVTDIYLTAFKWTAIIALLFLVVPLFGNALVDMYRYLRRNQPTQ